MLRITTAFALAISLPAGVLAAPGAPRSPLDSHPARIRYVSNDAPFVVFDVSPRSVSGLRGPEEFREATLSFVATDVLRHVNVFTFSSSARHGMQEAASRVACGAKIAGSYSCAVPTQEALSQLKGAEGLLGLRIEAEGLEGDRSTVLITLPVKAGAARPPPAPAPASVSPPTLTLLAAPAAQ